jgi:DNA processing protein
VNTNHLQLQIALTFLQGIGSVRARLLLSKMPDLNSLFTLSLRELEQITGLSRKLLKQMNRDEALLQAEKHLSFMEKNQVKTFFIQNPDYPRRLKQCEDAPMLLYGQGNLDLNPLRSVAIVGTRNATEYGREICEKLILSLIGKNVLVVSGMAYGIDICVHQLCVKHNVPTIGVLGHGLDRLYPSVHKNTAQRMLDTGGLLTEFLPGTLPDRENFPMRNRIVAGMCDATIVVESKNKGGSLITADLANDYSRDVFAVPGNIGQIYSEGCNQLISSSKAHLYLSPEHFLKWMDWGDNKKVAKAQRALFSNLTTDEKTMVDLLQNEGEQHMDSLAYKSKMPISKTSVILFQLEMNGLVKALPGKKYVLVA